MKKLHLISLALITHFSIINAYQTRNVFVVVIDGARYSETFGDTAHRWIPGIWNKLRPQGTIYTSHYTDSATVTNQGHATILTGTWQRISNDGSERPHRPTIFEYLRKEKGVPITQAYVALGKDKLDVLTHGDDTAYGANYRASLITSPSQYDDRVTYKNIRTVMDSARPRLLIANFAQTDNRGHANDLPAYQASIRQADSLVMLLWRDVQTDTFYRGTTTMIVVNDHGRHTTDFTSHGDTCEGCRHIMLMVIGPDTPRNTTITTRTSQVDIAPTIGELLGFGTPMSVGTPILSAFKKGSGGRGARTVGK